MIFRFCKVESLVVVCGINSKMELNSGEFARKNELWVKVSTVKMSVIGWNVVKVRQ